MNFISKEEYLKLIESAQDDQEGYDQIDNYDISDVWMQVEYPNKEKMLRAREASTHGMIDVLKYRKEQIRDAIYKYMNLQVGEFTIHIKRYNGHPKDKQLHGPLTLDISIMQEKHKTPSGSPCKMSYKFDFFQDNRFTKQPWITYFNASGYANDIPVETLVEVIRWLQALRRLNSFL
jgi:hypothetical protein